MWLMNFANLLFYGERYVTAVHYNGKKLWPAGRELVPYTGYGELRVDDFRASYVTFVPETGARNIDFSDKWDNVVPYEDGSAQIEYIGAGEASNTFEEAPSKFEILYVTMKGLDSLSYVLNYCHARSVSLTFDNGSNPVKLYSLFDHSTSEHVYVHAKSPISGEWGYELYYCPNIKSFSLYISERDIGNVDITFPYGPEFPARAYIQRNGAATIKGKRHVANGGHITVDLRTGERI